MEIKLNKLMIKDKKQMKNREKKNSIELLYNYNSTSHVIQYKSENFLLEFVLPSFKGLGVKDYYLNKMDTTKRYFQINRRNFIYRPYEYGLIPRRAQGLYLVASYISEAITTVAGACGMYYTYHLFSDFTAALRGTTNLSLQVIDTLKTYLIDIIAVLALVTRYLSGKLTITEVGVILTSYLAGKALLPKLSLIMNYITNLVPDNSTYRHTQGKDLAALAHGLLGIVSIFVLGQSVETTTVKGLLTSVRSLGSTLLVAKTIEQVVCGIFSYLPDIIQYFVCEKFPLVAMYMAIVNEEGFKKRLEELVKLKFTNREDILYNSHNLSEFLRVRSEFKDFVTKPENIKRGYDVLLSEYIDLLDDIYYDADLKGLLPNKRKLPFVVWLSGSPGIGKSTFAKILAKDILSDILDIDSSQLTDEDCQRFIYTHNSANKFFDGYHNQPIFILNDYLQFMDASEEQWLIKFVDTLDCSLEPSSVDNVNTGIKGEIRFTSRIIIVTSNTNYLNASANISNITAFNRRRDVVVNMTWKNSVHTVDFNNFNYGWARFTLMPNVTTINPKYEDIETLDQLRTYIKRVYIQRENNSRLLIAFDGTPTQKGIRGKVEEAKNIQSHYDGVLARCWDMIKDTLKLKVFGIPLYYIVPCLVAGSASYILLSNFIASSIPKYTQSLSGDNTTMKYKKVTRPIKRVAMGYTQNIYEIANVVRKNMIRITTVVTLRDGRKIQQVMWALGLGGTIYITPKHLWKRGEDVCKEGDLIVLDFKGTTFTTHYTEQNIKFINNADLACYNFIGVLPPIKSIMHMFIEDSYHIDSNGEEAVIITPKEEVSQIIPIEAYITDAPYTDMFGGTYDGVGLWQYNHKMMVGDCGSVLMLTGKSFERRIAGLHVAGDDFSGNSEIITKQMVDSVIEYFGQKKSQGLCTDAIYEHDVLDGDPSLQGNVLYLGKVKNAPFQATRTEIIKGPLFEVLQPHVSEPAVLVPSDNRVDNAIRAEVEQEFGKFSPMLLSVSKYTKPIVPFDHKLMQTAYRIVASLYDPLKIYEFKKFSANDAISSRFTPFLEPLDLNTSAGYPWNVSRKTKKDLILNENGVLTCKQELADKITTCENLLNKNVMFPFTLTTTLKDERVSLEKIKNGKTRTFMNFPVEYTILMRMYFDDFIDKETKHAMEIGTTSGVNIYSTQWHTIYNGLKKYDNVLDGDFKAFDGSIRPEFFLLYSTLVNSFYKDQHGKKRDMLLSGCCFSPILVLNELYLKLQGNPSGSRITTSFNSFVNRMYVVMSILSRLPPELHSVSFFKKNFFMFAHGDDHIVAFNNSIRTYWDGLKLRDFMLEHRIEYTSSKKDQPLQPVTPLDDVYYLKCRFVNINGRIQAGLDKKVIQEMVSWQRDNTLTSTEMILNTALRYAYFWGQEYFDSIYSRILEGCKMRHLNIKLVQFLDLENEYLYEGQMEFNYL